MALFSWSTVCEWLDGHLVSYSRRDNDNSRVVFSKLCVFIDHKYDNIVKYVDKYGIFIVALGKGSPKFHGAVPVHRYAFSCNDVR